MTRQEFDIFVESCYARGFAYVKTSAGKIDLANWRPYGAFDGSNQGIEDHLGGFRWIAQDKAADYQPAGKPECGVFGVWTFLREEEDEILNEQNHNYNSMIGASLRSY